MNIARVFQNFSSKHQILQKSITPTKRLSAVVFCNGLITGIKPYGTLNAGSSRFLDATSDIAFKRIFGCEQNADLLKDFLNSIMAYIGRKPLSEIQLQLTQLNPEISRKKMCIVDVLAKDIAGSQVILEMQLTKQVWFEKRAQYYAANVYARQINKASPYQSLNEVIFIAITNFILIGNSDSYKSLHTIRERQSNVHLLKDLSFVFFELPKFKMEIQELHSDLDKWIYFLKNGNETSKKDVETFFKGSFIQKAFTELDKFNWTDEELHTYYEELITMMDRNAEFEEVTKKAKKDIARFLLKNNIPHTLVTKATDLTSDELEDLIPFASKD